MAEHKKSLKEIFDIFRPDKSEDSKEKLVPPAKDKKTQNILNALSEHSNPAVRQALENANYQLDGLIHHPDVEVRLALAKTGYATDELLKDTDWNVRFYAGWTTQNTDIWDLLVKDDDWRVRERMAKVQISWKSTSATHSWVESRLLAEQQYNSLSVHTELLYHLVGGGLAVKHTMYGYGLDVLIEDKDPRVRLAVAQQGYGLDVLVHDKDSLVREAVAKHGYGLDELITDDDWRVRAAVAEHGFGLGLLVNDKNINVLLAVANQKFLGPLEQELLRKNIPEVCAVIEQRRQSLDVSTEEHKLQNVVSNPASIADEILEGTECPHNSGTSNTPNDTKNLGDPR